MPRYTLFMHMKAGRLMAILVAAIITALVNPQPVAADNAEHVAALLDGVKVIAKPGVPGPIQVFGRDAFAVVPGQRGDGLHMPVVAAATHGRGRVIAFGHGGYLNPDSLREHDTSRLLRNAITWAGQNDNTSKPLRVVLWGHDDLAQFLRDEFEFGTLPVNNDTWQETLHPGDVLVVNRIPSDRREQRTLLRFVEQGGGLISAQLGWGWQQLNPGKTLRDDFAANQLFSEFGLIWSDGTFASIPAMNVDGQRELRKALHIDHCLQQVETGGTQNEIRQAIANLTALAQAVPTTTSIYRELMRIANVDEADLIISEQHPMDFKRPKAMLATVIHHSQLRDQTSRIEADPSAAYFPGDVPRDVRSPREIVTIDLSTPGWASTGLYIPPGEIARIRVVGSKQTPTGLTVQVGCHTDRLWNKERWERHPQITDRFELDAGVTIVQSAFGGLLYINVSDEVARSAVAGDSLQLAVSNTVRAPRFVLDETDPSEWRETIRLYPAPWAELETDKIILTTQSTAVRELDDPVALLNKWNDALDCYAELSQRPLSDRPQRMVCDVQISAGYMHAGYPIMMHLDQVNKIVDIENLDQAWGYWHEIGHNHQQGAWTFNGTGEVTCNLFTLYVIEHFTGIPAAQHERVTKQADAVEQHLAAGAPFDQWKRKPFLALAMYMQLQEAFGWNAYKQVFATYRDLPREQLPRNDQDKRDQWMVRFSRQVERNLGPFFDRWGVPTTQAARDSVSDLPVWMPDGWATD